MLPNMNCTPFVRHIQLKKVLIREGLMPFLLNLFTNGQNNGFKQLKIAKFNF